MPHEKEEPLTACDDKAAKLFLFALIGIPILLAVVWLLS